MVRTPIMDCNGLTRRWNHNMIVITMKINQLIVLMSNTWTYKPHYKDTATTEILNQIGLSR